ncbi:hypothetical protein EYF80_003792 [Liparis tanakae]|uniref:Uncharacterized protein n=1 Tax=Liparis tanakae TaxID=230148 RepID=A0A4Z2J8B5_9TELE|nr:hypothetical protein EYF80_003792 [Liparis tanakae]
MEMDSPDGIRSAMWAQAVRRDGGKSQITRAVIPAALLHIFVMLSKSAPCCWQLMRASLHDSVDWKLNW